MTEELKLKGFKDTLKSRRWPITPPPTKEEVLKGDRAPEYAEFIEENLHWKNVIHKEEALRGLRVFDASIWRLSGAFCSSIFAEFGAEVIKIEPLTGDPLRQLTPFGREEYMLKDSDTDEPCGLEFINEMRSKYSITLNLEHPEGRELLKKLIVHADVFIEDYPPGQFDEWGIGYRQLSKINGRLVYIYLPMLGGWGVHKDKVSKSGQWMLDPIGQCACEFVHSTGFPADLLPREKGGNPTRSGHWIADMIAGEHGFTAAMTAILYRDEVSGKGQYIEAPSNESYLELDDFNIAWYGFDRSIKSRTGGWDPNLNQYAWNPCADGFMMIGGQSDRLWYRIVQCLEKDIPEGAKLIAEDPFLKEMGARNSLEGLIKTYTITSYWLKDLTRAEAEHKLLEYGIAAGPVMDIDEVAEYPHFKYRAHVMKVEDEHYGKLLVAPPPHLHHHRTPARIKWLGRPLGHDNNEIYMKLIGIGPTELKRLNEEGVI